MKARKAFHILLGVCAGIVLLIVAALYLGNMVLTTEAHRIAVARANDEATDEQLVATRRLKVKLEELGKVDTLAQKFLPAEKDQSAVIAEIYQYAASTGIVLNNLGFTPTTDEPSNTSQTKALKGAPGVLVYPFTSSIDCTSPTELIKFLNQLELNRRKMQITTLNIQRVNESTDKCSAGNLIVSSLEIEVYLKSETATSTPKTSN